MPSNILNQDDLVDYFSRSALSKRGVYQAQGRVSALEVSDDLTEVRAHVRGSERTPYSVDISLRWRSGELDDVAGDCTCFMNFNFKHVAATLLEALHGKEGCGARAAAAYASGLHPA